MTKDKNAPNNAYRREYDTAKENLRVFHQELKQLYTHTNLENRQAAFLKLKEKYGPLDKYQKRQEATLNRAKTVLTSKYMTWDGWTGFSFSNDYVADGVNKSQTNKFYDKTLDLNSKYNIDIRNKNNITLEEDQEALDRLESKNVFTTNVHTDAWGRDYDHPDYGIDPSSINRTIVTPTPVNNNNNNNKKEETPNRLELMTQSIKDNPSRIQQKLMDSNDLWTPERLAGLKIKHQDWKAERRNRKNLQVEATT
tara:strand:- start:2108 stop:2866 length:759 start_codon:yes stop_codon:yes gene_type:complete